MHIRLILLILSVSIALILQSGLVESQTGCTSCIEEPCTELYFGLDTCSDCNQYCPPAGICETKTVSFTTHHGGCGNEGYTVYEYCPKAAGTSCGTCQECDGSGNCIDLKTPCPTCQTWSNSACACVAISDGTSCGTCQVCSGGSCVNEVYGTKCGDCKICSVQGTCMEKDCDDGNDCTSNYCSNDVCFSIPIEPCCGNGICERVLGETCGESGCLVDCGECSNGCDYSPTCSNTIDYRCKDVSTIEKYTRTTLCDGGCSAWSFESSSTCPEGTECYDPDGNEGTDAQCKDKTCPDADLDDYEDKKCGGTDCDDTNANIYPGAPEDTSVLCTDGKDNDCDGLIDCLDNDCDIVCRPTISISPEELEAGVAQEIQFTVTVTNNLDSDHDITINNPEFYDNTSGDMIRRTDWDDSAKSCMRNGMNMMGKKDSFQGGETKNYVLTVEVPTAQKGTKIVVNMSATGSTASDTTTIILETTPPEILITTNSDPCTTNPLEEGVECDTIIELDCFDSMSGCNKDTLGYIVYSKDSFVSCPDTGYTKYVNPFVLTNYTYLCTKAEDYAGNINKTLFEVKINKTFIIKVTGRVKDDLGNLVVGSEVNAYLCEKDVEYCNRDVLNVLAKDSAITGGEDCDTAPLRFFCDSINDCGCFKVILVAELIKGEQYKVGIETEKGYSESVITA